MRECEKKKYFAQAKAPEGFEPSISCLLDRRFNQLSHGAGVVNSHLYYAYTEATYILCQKKCRPTWGSNPRP